jgi:hypothetical protein
VAVAEEPAAPSPPPHPLTSTAHASVHAETVQACPNQCTGYFMPTLRSPDDVFSGRKFQKCAQQ